MLDRLIQQRQFHLVYVCCIHIEIEVLSLAQLEQFVILRADDQVFRQLDLLLRLRERVAGLPFHVLNSLVQRILSGLFFRLFSLGFLPVRFLDLPPHRHIGVHFLFLKRPVFADRVRLFLRNAAARDLQICSLPSGRNIEPDDQEELFRGCFQQDHRLFGGGDVHRDAIVVAHELRGVLAQGFDLVVGDRRAALVEAQQQVVAFAGIRVHAVEIIAPGLKHFLFERFSIWLYWRLSLGEESEVADLRGGGVVRFQVIFGRRDFLHLSFREVRDARTRYGDGLQPFDRRRHVQQRGQIGILFPRCSVRDADVCELLPNVSGRMVPELENISRTVRFIFHEIPGIRFHALRFCRRFLFRENARRQDRFDLVFRQDHDLRFLHVDLAIDDEIESRGGFFLISFAHGKLGQILNVRGLSERDPLHFARCEGEMKNSYGHGGSVELLHGRIQFELRRSDVVLRCGFLFRASRQGGDE